MLESPHYWLPGKRAMLAKLGQPCLCVGAGIMALLAADLSPVPATAAVTTATFAVSATVEAMCNVSTNPLVFGAFGGAVLTSTSAIVVTCTSDTTYNVGIAAGLATGATVTNRQMTLAAGRLHYSLSSDTNHSVNWSQSIGVDTQAGTGTGYGNNTTLTVYGQVAAGQLVNPGSYADIAIVTVTF